MTQTIAVSGRLAGRRDVPISARRLISLAELGLLVALTYVLARMIWFIAFGTNSGAFQLDDLTRADPAGRPTYSADLSRLHQTGLFNDPRRADTASTAVELIPETRLPLVLRGVRRGATPEAGGAIIQTSGNQQTFFRVGAEILNGTTLEGVHVDHVQISRRGVAEVLYLRAEDAEAARNARAARRAAPAPRGRVEDVAGLIQVRAQFDGDTLSGYRIEGGNAALLQVLGLRESDVVTAIEGRPVAELGDLQALLDRDSGRNTISLSISRGGLPLTISRTLPQ